MSEDQKPTCQQSEVASNESESPDTAPSVQEAAEKSPGATAEEDEKKLTKARKIIRTSIAVVSFVAGFILGPYAEEMLSRVNPGFFGPDNQQIIDDQRDGFTKLENKLAELKLNAGKDPKTAMLIGELASMIEEQKTLAARKDEMFKAVDVEKQMLSKELLDAKGTSGAVGFWLKPYESVKLKDPTKVFSFARISTNSNTIQANISGEKTSMYVGDKLRVETANGPYLVVYRYGQRKSDSRHGFDLTPLIE